jgi:hypothetical protein
MTKDEVSTFLELGERTCDLLRVAYPSYEIAVEINPQTEVLIFSVGTNTYKVNVMGDSIEAGLVDIANQLLSKFIKDHK